MRRFALTALALLVALPVRADFQTALDAYNAGDYETAYREWLPLAEKDSPPAQFNIGLMFERGEGREQDFKLAVEWYLRAAENGLGRAQFRLGELYEAGEHIEQDLVQARKWFTIAAQSRHPGANKRRKKVAKRMTPGEIALGDMWAREYRKGKKN
jgi:TPR repeat protein